MATYVRTRDVKIFIDPGVSVAPRRYGLPPHPIENERKKKDWKKIVRYAKKSDIIIITHYHYDHHDPNNDVEIYEDKLVLIKHPTEFINWSQKRRAYYYLKKIEGLPSEIIYADGKSFEFGNTKIIISPPVPHGTTTRLGWVIQVLIDDGKDRFLFSSDIQGAPLQEQLDFILKMNPTIAIIDGPSTYLLGRKVSEDDIKIAFKNLLKIARKTDIRELIVDHHFLRDLEWGKWLEKWPKKRKKIIKTAADYIGQSINLLEANRKKLYEEYQP